MLVSLPSWRVARLPKIFDLFTPLLFLYFVTLHADRLNLQIGGTLRFNNFLAFPLLIVLMTRFRGSFFRIERWLGLALLAVLSSILLSLVCSPHWKRCTLHFCWFGFTFLCYFWMPYQLLSKLDQGKILRLYFFSFLVVGAYAFCQLFTGFFHDPMIGQYIIPGKLGRPNACSYEPSYYVLYMTPFVMLRTFLYLNGEERISRKEIFFINICYFVSASAATVCSYVTFTAIALFFKKCRRKLAKFWVVLILALLPLFVFAGALAMNFFLKNLDSKGHHSMRDRREGIRHCWQLFLEKPFIGYGLGGVCEERIAKGLVPKKFRDAPDAIKLKGCEPTNLGTEVLSSLGIVGALAFTLLVGGYFVRHAQVRQSLLHDAFFISVAVMLVTWQFNQSLLRTYTWAHFAFACALLQTTRQSRQSLDLEESA